MTGELLTINTIMALCIGKKILINLKPDKPELIFSLPQIRAQMKKKGLEGLESLVLRCLDEGQARSALGNLLFYSIGVSGSYISWFKIE